MTKLQEHDAMVCRSCGNEERASEGYPCVECGTFLCVICDLRGIRRCRTCEATLMAALQATTPPPATIRTKPVE